jgi:hypothetical protein
LAPYEIKAIHPDDFVLELINIDLGKVCQAMEKQKNILKNPSMTQQQYLDRLQRQGLRQTVDILRKL